MIDLDLNSNIILHYYSNGCFTSSNSITLCTFTYKQDTHKKKRTHKTCTPNLLLIVKAYIYVHVLVP